MGRRNLTDFQRNKIALKYEAVIAKRMKERQSAAGGDKRSVNAKNIASDHLVNSDKTTKRAELVKIAGTSQGSIQRTKLILDKGTSEQIERAEKGGKGNSVSAIAREIEMEQRLKGDQKIMDNRQTTELNRYSNHITACKILRVQENTVTVPLPWGGTTTLTIISDIFEPGEWIDLQFKTQSNGGRVTSYSVGYIGRTPAKFIPEDDKVQFVTA